MIKKFIYSTMVLSMAIMPLSTVLADDISTSITLDKNMTMNNGDAWAATATVTNPNPGYIFTLNGYSNKNDSIPANTVNYIQNGGTLDVKNNSYFKLWGYSSKVAKISSGNINVGSGSSSDTSVLKLDTASLVEASANITLNSGSEIIVYGNDGKNNTLYIDNSDTWNGKITVDDHGVLNLYGRTSDKNGSLNVKTSSLNLINGSDFKLNNSNDSIDGGAVSIGGNTGTINKLDVSKGNISKNAIVNIDEKNTLAVSGGTATLDDVDSWEGKIDVSGGTLTFDGRNDTITGKGPTTTTKTYNQTGGTLNLGSTTASQLTLNTSDSKITGGTVNMDKGSTLTLNNGLDINNFKLVTNNDGTNPNTFVLGNGVSSSVTAYTATDDTEVGSAPTVKINSNALYNINNSKLTLDSGDTWNGSIANAGDKGGTLTLDGRNDITSSTRQYMQTNGTLNLGSTATSKLTMNTQSENNGIFGGVVNMDKGSTLTLNNNEDNSFKLVTNNDATKTNTLVLGNEINPTATSFTALSGTDFNKNATLVVDKGATYNINGSKLTLDSITGSADTWNGTITNNVANGSLVLDTYENGASSTNVYQQSAGNLVFNEVGAGKEGSILYINTSNSYINGGKVDILAANKSATSGNSLLILSSSTNVNSEDGYMIGSATKVNIARNGGLGLTNDGNAILNDITGSSTDDDTWAGNIMLLAGEEKSPTLTLKNVTKDFTSSSETANYTQYGGNLNIYGNANGGSNLLVKPGDTEKFVYSSGNINVKGYDNGSDVNVSSLNLTYDSANMNDTNILENTHMQGNSELRVYTNGNNITHSVVAPVSEGANNKLVINNNQTGSYTVNRPNEDTTMGYGVEVKNGSMNVNTKNLTIGTLSPNVGLTIGSNDGTTYFTTNALNNKIYGDLALYDGWFSMTNPNAYTNVTGNMTTGSGVDMMQGVINKMDVDGTLTINNLDVKIDIDPQRYLSDTINATSVVQNGNLNLADFKLLSQPTEEKYTFRVVNATSGNYADAGTKTVTAQNQIIESSVGYYAVMPSSVKGAFDMALVQYKPEVFKGQVLADTIYANQLVITNQLFDRMFYSNLPYFNGECSNKTAAANTLFSPYQYTTNDTGLWFKPYGNFEHINLTQGISVENDAYGALIGADFKKKNFGKGWSFIPTAYIGYNGNYAYYNGVKMTSNGGQAGFMGTFTKKDFITGIVVNGGAYGGYYSGQVSNAIWNVGVSSKSAYNIHLPWNLILQPTVYLAYNYVGASDIDANGMTIKVDPLNAFNIAPGVNLIWQKETFSIYAMFQTMFNINGGASGSIANITLPQVAMNDPYFEYGLGFTKFFKDRFSGYAQAVGRAGSRTGIGFQLGMNMKI